MRTELGFEPRWTTKQALDDFARNVGLRRVVRTEWVDRTESVLLSALGERMEAR